MPVRQVLEATSAVSQGFVCRGEGFDHGEEVLIVVRQFELDGAHMTWIPRDGLYGFRVIPVRFDERLETHSFEALRDGAAVPPQCLSRDLHVEAMLPQAVQHGMVACRVGENLWDATSGSRRDFGQAQGFFR